MGEIADMMLDGTLDCMTGEYIGRPCGYPRTTNYPRLIGKKNRPQYSEAALDIMSVAGCYGLRGSLLHQVIGFFLQDMGVHPLPKLDAQFELIRGKYRNEFIQLLKTKKDYDKKQRR